jgi:hypothetical protein
LISTICRRKSSVAGRRRCRLAKRAVGSVSGAFTSASLHAAVHAVNRGALLSPQSVLRPESMWGRHLAGRYHGRVDFGSSILLANDPNRIQ